MGTNFYFNNFATSEEQLLIEDLIIESIRIYGQDMLYIPRNLGNYDGLYTSDDQSYYNQSFSVEMYIKSVDGFGGDGSFMSKFGLEVRDQVVFSMAQKVFNDEIGAFTNKVRPQEGDLIFFPLNGRIFQIKYVNKFEMFYQLNALQTWEMTCELFEYSDEFFDTGIDAIDSIQQNYSTNVLNWGILTEDGYYLIDEGNNNYLVQESYADFNLPGQINQELKDGSNNYPTGSSSFIDFSAMDPFSDGTV
jgi:hypothetical protein